MLLSLSTGQSLAPRLAAGRAGVAAKLGAPAPLPPHAPFAGKLRRRCLLGPAGPPRPPGL